jgi:hypothetical protein
MMTPSMLFGSDRTKPCVRQIFGVSGSGKTYMTAQMLNATKSDPNFGPLWRGIVFDVKHEGYADLVETVDTTTDEAISTILDENRIAVVHADIETAQSELDSMIEWLFDTAQRLPDFSATLILEESSTFITPTKVPDSIKRMATQGRSLGLSLILANQRALSNKWTDTQSTSITMFRLAIPDRKLLHDRWGIKADELDQKLAEKKFSFAHYDLEDLSLKYFSPIEAKPIKKPRSKKKKSLTARYRPSKRSL